MKLLMQKLANNSGLEPLWTKITELMDSCDSYLEQKEISDKKHARGSADLLIYSFMLKDFPICSNLLNV